MRGLFSSIFSVRLFLFLFFFLKVNFAVAIHEIHDLWRSISYLTGLLHSKTLLRLIGRSWLGVAKMCNQFRFVIVRKSGSLNTWKFHRKQDKNYNIQFFHTYYILPLIVSSSFFQILPYSLTWKKKLQNCQITALTLLTFLKLI